MGTLPEEWSLFWGGGGAVGGHPPSPNPNYNNAFKQCSFIGGRGRGRGPPYGVGGGLASSCSAAPSKVTPTHPSVAPKSVAPIEGRSQEGPPDTSTRS